MRQHPYYGGASKVALLKMYARMKTNWGKLRLENDDLRSKLAE